MIKLYSFLLIIFFSINTFAHQPRLNEEGDYAMSKDDPYIIKDPEISKAIYSILDGAEHFYKIKSDEDFNMYAGITVAKQDDCPDEFQKFSFSILDENFNTLHAFDGESFKWWSWYEEYGKKWYWVGPEYGADFKSTNIFKKGTYYLKVNNNSNQGNYVLAVGDIEKFNALVIGKMMLVLPKINKIFWNKNNCS
ncbi:MAG: hypothetical protein O3C64_00485 [Proteobacteria bacterium]|nr:hypothetical protein [Pseudomonadota bacterium]MDA1180823.1 hypothetical protein [Pseudomonadota bacterium]